MASVIKSAAQPSGSDINALRASITRMDQWAQEASAAIDPLLLQIKASLPDGALALPLLERVGDAAFKAMNCINAEAETHGANFKRLDDGRARARNEWVELGQEAIYEIQAIAQGLRVCQSSVGQIELELILRGSLQRIEELVSIANAAYSPEDQSAEELAEFTRDVYGFRGKEGA